MAPHSKRRAAALLLFLTTVLIRAPAAPLAAADEVLVLRDVVLPGLDGAAPRAGQSIVIRGDRIVAVGPTAQLDVPRRATIVPGEGRFAIPGLADLHVHINRASPEIDRLFPLLVAHGVTTVLNLDGGPALRRYRDEVAQGQRLGPRVWSAGPIIRGYEGMTAADGARVVREQVDAGYDMIKVYNGVPEEAYRAIAEAAKEAGVKVIGHAVRSVGIEGALETGQHLAHMEEVVYGSFTWRSSERSDLPEDVAARLDVLLDEAKIPQLARRVKEAGIFVIPNLVAYRQIAPQVTDLDAVLARPEIALMPETMVRSWQRDRNGYAKRDDPERFLTSLRRTSPFLQKLTAGFQEAGVPLLAGTDLGIPTLVAGLSLLNEIEQLVAAGLTPARALAAATSTAARFLDRPDAGAIEPGFVADIVLLRADPLADIQNLHSLDAVVVAGRLLQRDDLDRILHQADTAAPAGATD